MKLNTKTSPGFILPVVLLFLMIFALLAVNALTTSELELQMSRNTQQQMQNFAAADTGLNNIVQHLNQPENLVCFTGVTLTQPWRQTSYCSLQVADKQLQYVVEPLTEAGSGCVTDQKQQQHAIGFYRVSLWLAQQHAPLILQATVALPLSEKCTSNLTEIHPGRLSWRVAA